MQLGFNSKGDETEGIFKYLLIIAILQSSELQLIETKRLTDRGEVLRQTDDVKATYSFVTKAAPIGGRIRQLLAPDLPEKYSMANEKQEIQSDSRTVSIGLIDKGFSQRSILETFAGNCFDYKYPVQCTRPYFEDWPSSQTAGQKKGH